MNLNDLYEALNILEINEMKKIARSLNGIKMNGLTAKKNIITAIMKYCNSSQPVLQNPNQSNSVNEFVLKM
jgi:hypothetical protein